MATTTSSNVSPSMGTVIYFEREILKHAGPVTVLDKFGMSKPMPKNKGTVIEWRRPNTFTAATAPLVEGTTPTATAFSYTTVSASLKQYGQVVELTDVIEDTHKDPVLNDASVQCGENVGRTIEALTYGVVKAGTSVEYANGTQRTDVNTPISLSKIRAVIRTLQAQKAMMITRIVDPSPDYGTKAVEAGFIAVCHTDLSSDIRNLPGFTPVAEYGRRQTVHERELGTVEEVRFITSPDLSPWIDAGGAKAGSGTAMVSTSGTSADVYPILIFGKEAYGCVPLKGMGAVEPTIIPVGQKTKDDPLGQRGYVGWKTWFVAKILNEAWLVRIECAATDL
jgi:N4-gp56 family major capsid protein